MNATESERIKVLYIAGDGRSGSTLLDVVLGQAPGYISTGELKMIWPEGFIENLLCGCGRPFRSCGFWERIVREAYGGWQGVDPAAVRHDWLAFNRMRHFLLTWIWTTGLIKYHHEQYSGLLSTLAKLYAAIQQVTQSRVIIDSSKSPTAAMALAQVPGLEVYVVHLVRDSRAVAYSMQRKKRRPEVANGEAYLRQFGPVRAAGIWLASNFLANSLRWPSTLGGRYRRVRYEDFVRSPQATLRAIGEFVGEPVDTGFFESEFVVPLGENHTVAGNPARFKRGPVEIRADDEWRVKMPRGQQWLITALTAPWLWKYGYFE